MKRVFLSPFVPFIILKLMRSAQRVFVSRFKSYEKEQLILCRANAGISLTLRWLRLEVTLSINICHTYLSIASPPFHTCIKSPISRSFPKRHLLPRKKEEEKNIRGTKIRHDTKNRRENASMDRKRLFMPPRTPASFSLIRLICEWKCPSHSIERVRGSINKATDTYSESRRMTSRKMELHYIRMMVCGWFK